MPLNVHDNENGALPPRLDPDPHGQAALLLIEALLHVLIEANVLTTELALSAVETALDVKVDVAEELGEAVATMEQSLYLLRSIALSLRGGR